MSDFFRVIIIRIFAGGIICTLAMMLAGEGAKKELVRIGCACLMIILVFTPLKGASFNMQLLEPDGELSDYVEKGLAQAERERFAAAAKNIEGHIVKKAAEIGVECRINVKYHVTEEKEFVIKEIRIIYSGADDDKKEALQKTVEEDCGVSAEQIIWEMERE